MVDKKNGIEVLEVNEAGRFVRLCSTAMPHIIITFQQRVDRKAFRAGRQGPAHLTKYLYGKLKRRATQILKVRFGPSPPRRSGK